MKAEKRQAEHTNFLLYKEQLENWINEKSKMIKDHAEITNEETLRTNLETLQVIYNRLPEGQSLYIIVKDAFEKTNSSRSDTDRISADKDMENLEKLWEQLESDVNDALGKMKSALIRFENFQDRKQKFDKWLQEKELEITEKNNNRGDLGEMRTVIERYLSQKQELFVREPELQQLKDIMVEMKWPQFAKEIQTLHSRWEEAGNQCEMVITQLQIEIREFMQYNQMLQDIEKWLLQVSFQLMAHNSLYISNKAQTKEQLAQHDILLADIKIYQSNIDELGNIGQRQVTKYELSNPYIRSTIETHIQNVQDSYNSLLNTSVQIKNRLEDSLKKFQDYENTLDDIERKLTEYQTAIPVPDAERPCQLEKGLSDLECAKGISNALNKEKQRLTAAIQACEAATASISRPSSPIEMSMQPIPEKELRVRAQLDDLSDNVSYNCN